MKGILIILLIFLTSISNAAIKYVTQIGAGLKDGTSWANAYNGIELNAVIGDASSGDQIWVATGTYYPGVDRLDVFDLQSGVEVYGGFQGNEIFLYERNFQSYPTILSGEVGSSSSLDNSYTVIGAVEKVDIILDGFQIVGGYQDEGSPFGNITSNGGGLYFYDCSNVKLRNLIIHSNYASGTMGSGIFISGCSNFEVINTLVYKNTGGSGVGIDLSNCTLTNCTLTDNESFELEIAADMDDNVLVNNSIIWGGSSNINVVVGIVTLNYSNYSALGNLGTFVATNNNITSDPLFADVENGDFRIVGISPCTDAGNDSYCTEESDVRGYDFPRKLNKSTGAIGTIDIGAYEYMNIADPLPVELTAFRANSTLNNVVLNWQTATEVNNYGFEVERKSLDVLLTTNQEWVNIGFVEGSGNSYSPKNYSFIDEKPLTDSAEYRLKQIDTDGNYTYYSETVKVAGFGTTDANDESLPTEYKLSQNYPNPFNPSTVIKYSIPVNMKSALANVKIVVFDLLGNEIATLVNENQKAGNYEVNFNAKNISSGIYFYCLTSGSFVEVKKVIMIK